ncbi:MAG: hypothetical protein LPD71_02800 [Shewanella sp.]|nr:hypothetical protein [Shewanella sp.]MCF1431929.1 hypothetical protein [Shewanella sp.]MCF1437703.1 hypothetical protein [Shewanella sp.]MCF1456777.1 hypothetical protein [Shewanella sp.]
MAHFHHIPALSVLFASLLSPVARANGFDILIYPLSFAGNQWQVGNLLIGLQAG